MIIPAQSATPNLSKLEVTAKYAQKVSTNRMKLPVLIVLRIVMSAPMAQIALLVLQGWNSTALLVPKRKTTVTLLVRLVLLTTLMFA